MIDNIRSICSQLDHLPINVTSRHNAQMAIHRHLFNVRGGSRWVEQIALHFRATFGSKKGELLLRFDDLGRGRNTHALSETRESLDNGHDAESISEDVNEG